MIPGSIFTPYNRQTGTGQQRRAHQLVAAVTGTTHLGSTEEGLALLQAVAIRALTLAIAVVHVVQANVLAEVVFLWTQAHITFHTHTHIYIYLFSRPYALCLILSFSLLPTPHLLEITVPVGWALNTNN